MASFLYFLHNKTYHTINTAALPGGELMLRGPGKMDRLSASTTSMDLVYK